MKRFLGLTVLILGLSVPAHAQSSKGGGAVAGASSGGVLSNGGGGGNGGGAAGGSVTGVSFHTLPVIPPANLRSTAVSGTDDSFVPSTFLPYDRAVAAGQGVLDARDKSVAEAAAENSRAHRLKARTAIIENAAGDAVIATP